MSILPKSWAALAFILAIAFSGTLALTKSEAGLRGFVNVTRDLKLRQNGKSFKHPDTLLRIGLPRNGPGKLSGRYFGGDSGAFVRNTGMHGRVRSVDIRQAGRKRIMKGKWTWKLAPNGLAGQATGKCRFTVEIDRFGITTLRGPIKLFYFSKHPDRTDENYSYRGRFRGVAVN